MDALDTIFTRKSVRRYLDKPIPKEAMDTILKAGASGPSCVNAKDWAFLVVEDREMLLKMAEGNGRAADPLKGAAAGILILGDLSRAFPPAKDYWVIDGAIAGQNMVLAAQALGIGSVWLGTWPQMERVENQKKLFNLPEHLVPHSILALGYEDDSPEHVPENLKRPPKKEEPWENFVYYEKV